MNTDAGYSHLIYVTRRVAVPDKLCSGVSGCCRDVSSSDRPENSPSCEWVQSSCRKPTERQRTWVIIGELHHPHLVRLNPSSYSNKIGLIKFGLVNAAEILLKNIFSGKSVEERGSRNINVS